MANPLNTTVQVYHYIVLSSNTSFMLELSIQLQFHKVHHSMCSFSLTKVTHIFYYFKKQHLTETHRLCI